MSVRVGTVEMPSPVMTASGTSGHGDELGAYGDLSQLGAIVVKSLAVRPWPGNPEPRLFPLAAGMLNSVGLQGPGIDRWLADGLPPLLRQGARVVVSVWGEKAEDFAAVARRLVDGLGALPETGPGRVVAVEANISCPNIEDRRLMFAHSPEATSRAVGCLTGALAGSGLPLWAKLSPNVTDLVPIAKAALENGAAALTLVNTLFGRAVEPRSGAVRLGGGGGGVSGPALHAIAVRAISDCRQSFPGTPIVGVGGVMRGEDAAELLAAGADAVQVGTATFLCPRAPWQVADELRSWCSAKGVKAVRDL